ncbi:MAG: LCP family protein [Candidatus Fimenecus sp.]
MADNRFKNSNDDFEDIFSNSSKNDGFEDIFSSSSDNDFEDISSYSPEAQKSNVRNSSENYGVKYNNSVQNRRRQEYEYGDVSEMYADIIPEKKKKKKRHPVRNTFLVFLCIVIAAVSCVGFYGYNTVNKLLSSFNTDEPLKDNEYIDDSELYRDSEQTNILLVGVDARESDVSSRSDTMMLLTIDNKNGQIKLTSFLRDSYVQIAGRKKEKLNAAYFRGGIQGLVDTLELNFKVEIPYYMLVDFEIFTTVVDMLGGIEVEVTEKESAYSKKTPTDRGGYLPLEAGENIHLNGTEALWYSRMRYLDSDFMRTQRQRKVITAIVEKAKQQKPQELLKLAETIIPLIKTNITADEMKKLGIDAVLDKAYNYSIVQQQIPADETWSNKTISGVGACLVMDLDENAEILADFLRNKQDTE